MPSRPTGLSWQPAASGACGPSVDCGDPTLLRFSCLGTEKYVESAAMLSPGPRYVANKVEERLRRARAHRSSSADDIRGRPHSVSEPDALPVWRTVVGTGRRRPGLRCIRAARRASKSLARWVAARHNSILGLSVSAEPPHLGVQCSAEVEPCKTLPHPVYEPELEAPCFFSFKRSESGDALCLVSHLQ